MNIDPDMMWHLLFQELGTQIATVEEVVNEITSKRQIRRLVVLPYDLEIKPVFQENIQYSEYLTSQRAFISQSETRKKWISHMGEFSRLRSPSPLSTLSNKLCNMPQKSTVSWAHSLPSKSNAKHTFHNWFCSFWNFYKALLCLELLNLKIKKLAGWDFGYCGHYWPIVPTPDDRWWCLWRNWWNEDWQGKPKCSEKTCPSATLSTTNPTLLDPGCHGGQPATNRLSYGAALAKSNLPDANCWQTCWQ
jgi:hypothetical protein